MSKKKFGPAWCYAVGSIAAVPLVVAGLLLAAGLMLLVWPFVPLLCYLQRREELAGEEELP